jgi:hypothetical protein
VGHRLVPLAPQDRDVVIGGHRDEPAGTVAIRELCGSCT